MGQGAGLYLPRWHCETRYAIYIHTQRHNLVVTAIAGYGKWADIVYDAELGLAAPLQAAVRIVESSKRTVKPISAPMAPPLPTPPSAAALPPLVNVPPTPEPPKTAVDVEKEKAPSVGP